MLAKLVMPGAKRGSSAPMTGSTWSLELKAPAHNEIYDFPITVHISARPAFRFARKDLSAEDRADVERRIKEIVRPKARTVLPDRPGQAEEGINEALTAETIEVGRMRVSAYAEVRIADELRTMQQERERTLHDVTTKGETSKLLAHQYAESRRVWEGFLDGAQRSWSASYAIQLAERPQDIATVFSKMIDARKDAATSFVSGLDRIAGNLEHHNIYDLVTESDHALRRAMEALGLRVPDRDPDPLVSG